MEVLTLVEKVEIVLIYDECGRSIARAINMYAERFPERNTPSKATFYRVVNNFTQSGSVQTKKRQRSATVTSEDNAMAVLGAIEVDPHVSSRRISRDSGIPRTSILRILKRCEFHPFDISLHQGLHGNNNQKRITFCRWVHEMLVLNRNFFLNVLFSDESSFTNHGQVNRHNMHYWSTEKPHWLRQIEH